VPLDMADLRAHFASQIVTAPWVRWDVSAERVAATMVTRLGALVLEEHATRDVPEDAVAGALVAEISRRGLDALGWSDAARGLQERVGFVRSLDPESLPDLSSETLAATMDEWLAPH